jgi:tRNA 2-thiouridine synthesizing protein B|tara:strand:+ start:262 stop:552 length:291 start_codon:yes stop_codon:yes gene_type:complete
MTSLHTISKAPSSRLFECCLPALKHGDGILFIEDGVYYCLTDARLAVSNPDLEVFSLQEDLDARGLMDRKIDQADVIDYSGFVELCCRYDKVISWF